MAYKILFVCGMIIYALLFGYLFFTEKDLIQKMVWIIALGMSPILFWGLNEIIHKINIKRIKEKRGTKRTK